MQRSNRVSLRAERPRQPALLLFDAEMMPAASYSPTVPGSAAWVVVVTGGMSAWHRLMTLMADAHELVERLVDELARRR